MGVDEAAGEIKLVHHASFNTLEENIEAVQLAEEAGARSCSPIISSKLLSKRQPRNL